jgi:hypothetical protein
MQKDVIMTQLIQETGLRHRVGTVVALAPLAL